MITRVEVEHYKSIYRLDLQMGRIALFVGVNGSGKSNIVDAIRLIRDAVTHGLDRAISERHGIDSIRQWSPSKPYFVNLKVHVETRMGHGHLGFTLASHRGSHVVRREEGEWNFRDAKVKGYPGRARYVRNQDGGVAAELTDDKNVNTQRFEAPPEELFVAQLEARRFRPLAGAIGSFEAYSIYPNTLRAPQKPSSDVRLSSSGDNLASVLKGLNASKSQNNIRARREILEAMQKVMPQLENIRIQSIGGLMIPTFRVLEGDGRVHDFNVSQVSDGTLRILGLLTALYQPHRPDVIAMEEPEQTVNPGVSGLIADAIQEIGETGQVIVTTHSPELLDRFPDPEVVYAVEIEDGITSAGKIRKHQRDAVRDRLFSLGELLSVEGLHA
jgi:predicted ATPase